MTKTIRILNTNEINPIKKARKTMADAFDADAAFEYGYIANIACRIHDDVGVDWPEANVLAENILHLVFRSQ